MSTRQHKHTALRLVSVVFIMGALAWASVPFYSWFCSVTGFGGTPLRSQSGAKTILDKTIKIRFDATTASNMPWKFKPVVKEMTLKIGETGLAFYEAYNPTDEVIAGTASYNVVPYDAGGYFTKIDCFCFQEQVLQPGERVEMPVSFFIDPAMISDPEISITPRITLSYTFYKTDYSPKQEEIAYNTTLRTN